MNVFLLLKTAQCIGTRPNPSYVLMILFDSILEREPSTYPLTQVKLSDATESTNFMQRASILLTMIVFQPFRLEILFVFIVLLFIDACFIDLNLETSLLRYAYPYLDFSVLFLELIFKPMSFIDLAFFLSLDKLSTL